MKVHLLKNKSLSFGKTCNSRAQFLHLFIPFFLGQKIYLNIRFGREFKSRFCKRIQRLLRTAKGLSAFCILTFGTVAFTTHKPKPLAFYLTSLIPFFCALLRSYGAHIRAVHFFADLHLLPVYGDVKLLLLFGFHKKLLRRTAIRTKEYKRMLFPSHSARNKGMARKDTFRLFPKIKRSLMYPLPLLQVRHQIFFSILL